MHITVDNYNDFVSAIKNHTSGEPLFLDIAPGVHWQNEPGSSFSGESLPTDDVALPFGEHLKCHELHIKGLGATPYDTVIASDIGQSHGCVGNFTMFLFECATLTMENLTLGNYCCVDLVYPSNPALNHKKRTSTITQAQLAFHKGDYFKATNCRFVSRLNLTPVCGAKNAYYDNCHFESTDDSMNAHGWYTNCEFDFYGHRPWYSATALGSVCVNCTFNLYNKPSPSDCDTYFAKNSSPFALVGCTFVDKSGTHNPNSLCVRWTKYPASSLRSYYANNTYNGHLVHIGEGEETSVDITTSKVLAAYLNNEDMPIWLLPDTDSFHSHEYEKGNGSTTVHVSDTEEIEVNFLEYYFDGRFRHAHDLSLCVDNGIEIISDNKLHFHNEHDTPITANAIAKTAEGLEGCVTFIIAPKARVTPNFISAPELSVSDGAAHINYEFESEVTDESVIIWQRYSAFADTYLPIGKGRDYRFTLDDENALIKATLIPKAASAPALSPIELTLSEAVSPSWIIEKDKFTTDFAGMHLSHQSIVAPGFFTMDFYTPKVMGTLKEWHLRETDTPSCPWGYDVLGNGCKGIGLHPLRQGVQLFYTPSHEKGLNYTFELVIDPAKTAGQGFGSAGQYIDILAAYNPSTQTGLALRIIRTAQASDAVEMMLIRIDDDVTTTISDSITTSCFLTDCHIKIKIADGTIHASAMTSTYIDPEKKYASSVDLVSKLPIDLSLPANPSVGLISTGTLGNQGWENSFMIHEFTLSLQAAEK